MEKTGFPKIDFAFHEMIERNTLEKKAIVSPPGWWGRQKKDGGHKYHAFSPGRDDDNGVNGNGDEDDHGRKNPNDDDNCKDKRDGDESCR